MVGTEPNMKKLVLTFVILCLGFLPAVSLAQGPGQTRPGENVVGKVPAVGKDSITVAPMAGGDPVTIKAGDSARIFKDREPIKLSDIKVDDTVFARGQLAGTSMDAFIVAVMNPEMVQRMQQCAGVGLAASAARTCNPEASRKACLASH